MATVDEQKEGLRTEWLGRLSALVDSVQGWARELGWSTRRIDKQMEDSRIGAYEAPALLLQEDLTRVLLEPIARFAPGAEGVVDLYLMPAYDDIATLFYYGGGWHLHYQSPEASPTAKPREDEVRPLSKETFRAVVESMKNHVS